MIIMRVPSDQKRNYKQMKYEGLKVNLEDKLDNWTKIRLADGKVGWIEQTYVEQI